MRPIAIVGFFLAGLFFVGALMFAWLFLVPGSSLFGVYAVDRETAITYRVADNPGLLTILGSNNIIISSHDIPVEIRMRKEGQYSEGSIEVWERATGVSFNGIRGTHVTWDQVIVVDEHGMGVPFARIFIHEPAGSLSRNGHVYINLFSDANSAQQDFNFILDTRRSSVRFDSDDTDFSVLNINTLHVRNARGSINFPSPTLPHHFRVNIQNIHVDSDNVSINNRVHRERINNPNNGRVRVTGNNVSLVLGNIHSNVYVTGNNARLNFGNVEGHVQIGTAESHVASATLNAGNIESNLRLYGNGTINVAQCHALIVRGGTVTATVRQRANQVDFIATERGALTVHQVSDDARRLLGVDDAYVRIIHGSVTLRNVFTNVRVWTINDSFLGNATAAVHFSPSIDVNSANLPTLSVEARDGNVTATNIVGVVNITVRPLGFAVINADFRRITGYSTIEYMGPAQPTGNRGNITVTLTNNIHPARITIQNSAGARNYTGLLRNANDELIGSLRPDNYLSNGAQYKVNAEGISMGSLFDNLVLITSNTIRINSRTG